MIRQDFPGHAQAAHVQPRVDAPVRGGNAVPQPARLPQPLHQLPRHRVRILFFLLREVRHFPFRPPPEAFRQVPVGRVEKRPGEVLQVHRLQSPRNSGGRRCAKAS